MSYGSVFSLFAAYALVYIITVVLTGRCYALTVNLYGDAVSESCNCISLFCCAASALIEVISAIHTCCGNVLNEPEVMCMSQYGDRLCTGCGATLTGIGHFAFFVFCCRLCNNTFVPVMS